MENKRKPSEESLWWIGLYERWHAAGCYWTILLNTSVEVTNMSFMSMDYEVIEESCWTLFTSGYL